MLAEMDNTAMMDEGFSEKEVRELQEGNLIPNGPYVLEITKVEFSNEPGAYTPKDENGNATGAEKSLEFPAEQHVNGYFQVRIADTYNPSHVGRKITNFMRFFNPAVPGLRESLPHNLRKMHDSAMGTIVSLVNASQVEVPVNEAGNKRYLSTFLTGLVNDPPLLVRGVIGRRPDQNGVQQNTVGGFKAYRG